MEILVKFTPEEYEEYQKAISKAKAYDKVVEQRDEVTHKFRKLQNAIEDIGYGITISCGSDDYRNDKYTLHEMDDELKAYYKKYPRSNGGIRPYQD